jgi:hypothetical protein
VQGHLQGPLQATEGSPDLRRASDVDYPVLKPSPASYVYTRDSRTSGATSSSVSSEPRYSQRALHAALDAEDAANLDTAARIIGKYRTLGKDQRTGGGQAIIQFVVDPTAHLVRRPLSACPPSGGFIRSEHASTSAAVKGLHMVPLPLPAHCSGPGRNHFGLVDRLLWPKAVLW